MGIITGLLFLLRILDLVRTLALNYWHETINILSMYS